MNKTKGFLAGVAIIAAFPLLVAAQEVQVTGGLAGYLTSISQFINSVLIPFILGIGFLFFVWGMFKYFIKGGDDEDARKEGKNLIVYATAGFVVIFIFWGLVTLLTESTGLSQPTNTLPIPTGPGA